MFSASDYQYILLFEELPKTCKKHQHSFNKQEN